MRSSDTFLIQITNKCTLTNSYVCDQVAGATNTIPSFIYDKMSDNGDGTYNYSYTLSNIGAITIIVKLVTGNGLYAEFFSTHDWSGSPELTTTLETVSFNKHVTIVEPTPFQWKDYITAYFYSTLVSVKENFNFYAYEDNGTKVIVDGNVIHDNHGSIYIGAVTYTGDLRERTYHNYFMDYNNYLYFCKISVEWESTSTTRAQIPTGNFLKTSNVGASPFQITVICYPDSSVSCTSVDPWSTGYKLDKPTANWLTKWGDGIKTADEKCDDGNLNNGDGWSSTWTVENGYKCSGGSLTLPDVWSLCPKGYYTDTSDTTRWITKWGDGFMIGKEKWDDGNAVDGDGWSADWLKVEDGYAWYGGQFGQIDICVKCDLGYDPSLDYTQCVGAQVPRDTKYLSTASLIAAILGMSTNVLVTTFSSSSSSSSSFGMMNQIQLVILLPLVGAYLPEKIYDYLKSMNASLFNLGFLPTNNSPSVVSFKSMFDFKQPNSYLYLIGLESGSSLVNILNLTVVVGMVMWVHAVSLILFWIFRKVSCCTWLKNLNAKILKTLTFGFYIGVYCETYILFLLVDFSEIRYTQTSGTTRSGSSSGTTVSTTTKTMNYKSSIVSYVICGFMGLFMLLTLWQWIKSRKPATFETQKYFTALLEGMKPKWICRSYYLVFLIRRTLFVAIIFFMQDIDMIYRIASFVAVQALLLIYILALRPQDGFKENFIDVINETFYLYFGAFMLYYNSEQTWTSTTTDVYFWILMANNFVLMLISFGNIWLANVCSFDDSNVCRNFETTFLQKPQSFSENNNN